MVVCACACRDALGVLKSFLSDIEDQKEFAATCSVIIKTIKEQQLSSTMISADVITQALEVCLVLC